MTEEGLTLGEIERRLSAIERKLDDRTYVQSEVFAQYQLLILEQNKGQSERISKLEAWQTSVYAMMATAFLGIIGSIVVAFVK